MHAKPPLAPFVMLALALVGVGIAGFLSYYQYNNLIPSCAIGGCEIVLTSPESKLLGLPWSYYGLVYYVYMLCLSVLLVIDPASRALKWGALAYAGIGALYSGWAIFYVQLSVIGAVCEYCAMSAATTLLLLITSVWHYRSSGGTIASTHAD